MARSDHIRIRVRNKVLDDLLGGKVTAKEYTDMLEGKTSMAIIEDGLSDTSAEYSVNAMLSIRDKARYGKNAANPDS